MNRRERIMAGGKLQPIEWTPAYVEACARDPLWKAIAAAIRTWASDATDNDITTVFVAAEEELKIQGRG